MKRYRVAVCGGRDYQDRAKVFATLDKLHNERRISLIVHGACCDEEGELRGADRWAEKWAILRQVRYSGEPAPWHTYGSRAGPVRNKWIAMHYGLDLVVAFPGGKGTANMVANAERAKVKVLPVKR